MAGTHLAYPDLALDKFSGIDPDQDAESFIQLIGRKIIFALGDALANPDALANYNFRKKALFLFTQRPRCRMVWKYHPSCYLIRRHSN